MSKEEFKQIQEKLLRDLELTKESVLKFPNTLTVGIGFKQSKGKFTQEISYRVFVSEKKDLASLREDEIIPPIIGDVKTDIITPLIITEDSNVCGDERRTLSTHRPLQGGIAISTDSTSYGTLGWFGKLDADDTPILLTNKHVLFDYSSVVDTRKLKVAQPKLGKVSKCCCCECGSDNVIGEVIIGIRDTSPSNPTSVDCGIAKINTEFASEINLVITNDSTAEVLKVKGMAVANLGDQVKKIGARSGYTQGEVVHLGDIAVAPATDSDGTDIEIHEGQILIVPIDAETYEVDEGDCKKAFSNSGDSGAVILNDTDEIIALNWNGDRTTNNVGITIANHIQNVLDKLSANGFPITLSFSPPDDDDNEIISEITPMKLSNQQTVLEKLRDLNKDSKLYELFEKHVEEVLDLVNHCRPVTLTWQRNQGPAFVAALGRAAKVREYAIPLAINDAKRSDLLDSMLQVLLKNGSVQLREDLNLYGPKLIESMMYGISIDDLAEALFEAGFIDQLPVMSNLLMS